MCGLFVWYSVHVTTIACGWLSLHNNNTICTCSFSNCPGDCYTDRIGCHTCHCDDLLCMLLLLCVVCTEEEEVGTDTCSLYLNTMVMYHILCITSVVFLYEFPVQKRLPSSLRFFIVTFAVH